MLTPSEILKKYVYSKKNPRSVGGQDPDYLKKFLQTVRVPTPVASVRG